MSLHWWTGCTYVFIQNSRSYAVPDISTDCRTGVKPAQRLVFIARESWPGRPGGYWLHIRCAWQSGLFHDSRFSTRTEAGAVCVCGGGRGGVNYTRVHRLFKPSRFADTPCLDCSLCWHSDGQPVAPSTDQPIRTTSPSASLHWPHRVEGQLGITIIFGVTG